MEPIQPALISVWKAYAQKSEYTVLNNDLETDVVVIGGGITGITTAYLLAKAGKKVVILEAFRIGESTTGYSTGNLYEPVDERLYTIKSKFDVETTKAIAQSRRQALEFIRNINDQFNMDCGFVDCNWNLFTEDEVMNEALVKEYEANIKAGVHAELKDSSANDFPIPFQNRIEIKNQAQYNPLQYVKLLAKEAEKAGCEIYENSAAISYDDGEECIVKTKYHTIKAKNIVLATHTPKGLLPVQTVLGPYREEGVALKLQSEEAYPKPGIYWCMKKGHHFSFRTYQNGEEKYLIVVGVPYKVGQGGDTEKGFTELMKFASERFPVQSLAYKWAAQHYSSADGLPYIGKSILHQNTYTATGFATDGLIYGTVAAQIITDNILEVANPFHDLYDIRRFTPLASAKDFLKENLNVAGTLIKDYIFKGNADCENIERGEGKIIKADNHKVAAYKDENDNIHMVSAVCTHLGCIVHWNPTEKSWDCPCHGSRFTTGGEIIEGPALKPLRKIMSDGE